MTGDDQPSGLGRSDLACGLWEATPPRQYLVGLRIEQHALSRRLQPPIGAVEQRETELLLKTSDLRTDGRLRHAHGRRGLRDGAVVDDRTERFEEAYIHCR